MPKIKNILIFSGIAVVLILIYVFFIKPAPEQASLQSTGGVLPNIDGTIPGENTMNTNSSIGNNFLTLLLSVENIKLNDAVLSEPAFNILRDSSIVLVPDGTEGRPNPFAKIGSDNIPLPPVVNDQININDTNSQINFPAVPSTPKIPSTPANTIPKGNNKIIPTP